MRVEKVTHKGKVRVVVIRGLDSFPEGLVMGLATFELIRQPLERKYGPAEEAEREATAEELAMVVVVTSELRGGRPKKGNGAG